MDWDMWIQGCGDERKEGAACCLTRFSKKDEPLTKLILGEGRSKLLSIKRVLPCLRKWYNCIPLYMHTSHREGPSYSTSMLVTLTMVMQACAAPSAPQEMP